MRLAIDGNEANVTRRVGSNVFAYEVIKRLPQYAAANDLLTLYLKSSPKKDISAIKGLDIKVIKPAKFWTRLRLPLELYRTKNQTDLFFSPGHYAPRPCPINSVIAIMDLAFLRFREDFLRKDYYQLANWTKYSVKHASHIIAISRHTKADITKYYQYSADQITVCPLAHDPKLFHSRATGRKPRAFSNHSQFILYVGTLQPRKNLKTLITAFARTVQTNPEIKLVIAGKKGWLYEEIFSQVTSLNLQNRVVFTGFILPAELVWLYRHALGMVLPSLYEGFGIPILEAMACGCPVICSRVSSLPEVGGSAAMYLNNPQDADELALLITKLIKLAPGQRQVISNSGIKQASRFSWDKTAKKIYRVLEETAKN